MYAFDTKYSAFLDADQIPAGHQNGDSLSSLTLPFMADGTTFGDNVWKLKESFQTQRHKGA